MQLVLIIISDFVACLGHHTVCHPPYETEANDHKTENFKTQKELGLNIVYFNYRDKNDQFQDWGDQKHTLCMCNQMLSKHFLIVNI